MSASEKKIREMCKALKIDGEKLRAITGEDHGPYFEEGKRKMNNDDLANPPPRNIEQQVVFAVSKTRDGLPLLMLGVPRGAWLYMKDGKTHTFDLTKTGLPIRLMMFGARSHGQIMADIQKHNSKVGVATDVQLDKDFSIKPEDTG